MSPLATQAIRYVAPLIVGVLTTWLASSLHIVVSPSSKAGLVALTVSLLTAGYAALAHLVEARWPSTGKYLLLAPKKG